MSPSSLKRLASTDRDVSPPPKRKAIATTTSKAVANFFKPTSEKVTETPAVTFQVVNDTLLVARHGDPIADLTTRPEPVQVAAFDFDDTVIKTASGNVFGRGATDWTWWHATVPAKLKRLHADGYALVIISNQAGVSLKSDAKSPKDGMKSLNNFKGKVTNVLTALDLPMSVYAATEKDLCRKPRTGMWERMVKDYGLIDDGKVDLTGCVFIGDAAGRLGDKAAKIKEDHSSSDRDLAANIGIDFKTPEEFFLDEAVKPFVRSFEPVQYLNNSPLLARLPTVFTKTNERDIALFCGSPGAGKSTFYWTHLKPLGYERVNQDILKSRVACVRVARQYLEDRKSVVVDNTNADIETRATWVRLAQKLNVPIRVVHFTAPPKLCEHNDTIRSLTSGETNPEARSMLPKLAFTGFAARYREPALEEGFQDITKVNFKFEGTEEQRAQWSRYWIS
ncbi:DNA kinase/phosphatase Pnk1 [Oleoguttula sp. CCFEE 5521]